ncbi:MAG: carbohydrate kinase, partial [Firmicutes bacterium]|nr:carbohydrate kinase [Bacillota bacterium]
MAYILAYDVGTTGVKTCLFRVDKTIELLGDASEGYGLYTFPDGGAEQHADEWWEAMCKSTREMLESTDVDPAEIKG